MSTFREILRQTFRGPAVQLVPGFGRDVLVFSMRGVADLPAYCVTYEFEDLVVALTGADRVGPSQLETVEFQRRVYKALYSVARSPSIPMGLTPNLGGLRLPKDYELFVAAFNSPYEVFALRSVPDWRARCRRAVCVITEAWESDLPEYLLRSLQDFDQIYLTANPVASVGRLTGRPCSYLPLGADALALCPEPDAPRRSIDVLGIGRRSAITHKALLHLARDRGLFYYYDTVRSKSVANASEQVTFSVIDPTEHRFKHANLLKRSRFFLASKGRANEARAMHVDEVSSRFFEGAAAGTIMIGDPPTTGPYLELFDWPDVVIPAPFDDPEIGECIARLDADPERCVRIRRENMRQALLRHDWVYRLRRIFEEANLPIPETVPARETALAQRAAQVQEAAIEP
ncbi:MAG: glycosyltransferase family protein [Panacagrimonas sp.]